MTGRRCLTCTGDGDCRPHWLYVAHSLSAGVVKVGMSVNPTRRLCHLRLQIARDIAVVHKREVRCWPLAAALETKTHRRLKSFGVGGERYSCAPATAIAAVENVR